jgi:uncharacterized protein YbjT (DUF2867 family)
MSAEKSRVRLHDVRVTGDLADHAAVLTAIQQAVGAAITTGRRPELRAVERDLREAVAEHVASPPDRV